MRYDLPRRVAAEGRAKRPAPDLNDAVHRPMRRFEARGREPLGASRTPRRSPRRPDPVQPVACALRTGEQKILTEVGRFRLVSRADLTRALERVEGAQIDSDLAFLRKKGWIRIDAMALRGKRGVEPALEVVSLTEAGCDVARGLPDLPRGQKLYAGGAKTQEIEHDLRIYRACCQEAERISREGGTHLRFLLDAELRSEVQKRINAARRSEPDRGMPEIRLEVARDLDLPFAQGGIQFPDARIEYDLDQGARTGHEDVEVLSASYKATHLRNKTVAGFHVYASRSDRARFAARAEEGRDLMEHVLEL